MPEQIKILFLLLIFITAKTTFCDEPLKQYSEDAFPRTAIFGEALGNGVFLSFNYEHFVARDIGIRAGVGTALLYGMTYPVMINYYYGGKNKHELGAGITILPGKAHDLFGRNEGFVLSSTIGLRHQKDNGGLVIRLAFTPFYNPALNRFKIFGGLSIGKAF